MEKRRFIIKRIYIDFTALRRYNNRAMETVYNIYADLHTHTTYSHGKGSVEDNVRAAKFRGLECIAITDHGIRHPIVGVHRSKFASIRADAERAADKYGIDVKVGIEANIYGLSGAIDLTDSDMSALDIILAGFHASARPQKISDIFMLQGNLVSGKLGCTSKAQRERNTKAYINCVKNYPVDILTHPGFWLDIDCYELGKACADYGTYIEISSRHRVPTLQGLEEFMRSDVKFVINSDAHKIENIGKWEYATEIAAKAGLSEERIVNAGDNPLELRSAKR